MKVFIVLCLAVASTCALNKPEARLRKGFPAKPNQFPYQVGLSLTKLPPMVGSWCSGSLIARNWVLTAAECAWRASENESNITVYLGSITLQGGTKVSATQVIVHPQYGDKPDSNNDYDIALVRIPAVSLSDSINIVPLPAISNTYSNYVNEIGIVSGWGKTGDYGLLTDTLLYMVQTVVDNSACSKVNSSPKIICIYSRTGTTCLGDLGNPFVLEKSGILVGFTAGSGTHDCSPDRPRVFTRVTPFRTWIKDITGV